MSKLLVGLRRRHPMYRGSTGIAVASTNTITVPVPQGTLPNDILFLAMTQTGSTTEPTVPSGWTATGSSFTWGSTRVIMWWRRVTTTAEPASYTFTMAASSTHQAVMSVIRGARTGTTPFGTIAPTNSTANATSITVPAATMPSPGGLVYRFVVANNSNTSQVATWPVSLEVRRQWILSGGSMFTHAVLTAPASTVATETVGVGASGPRAAVSIPFVAAA